VSADIANGHFLRFAAAIAALYIMPKAHMLLDFESASGYNMSYGQYAKRHILGTPPQVWERLWWEDCRCRELALATPCSITTVVSLSEVRSKKGAKASTTCTFPSRTESLFSVRQFDAIMDALLETYGGEQCFCTAVKASPALRAWLRVYGPVGYRALRPQSKRIARTPKSLNRPRCCSGSRRASVMSPSPHGFSRASPSEWHGTSDVTGLCIRGSAAWVESNHA